VRKDWPALVDILDKALGTIPGEERDRIHNAWVAVPRDKFNWRRLTTAALVVLAGAGLLIIGIAAWNRLLMREIAFRQKHELELRQARDAAYAASQAKSMFLANMSHEIRTPLNAIIGFAQILAADPALPGETREQVETILRSGEHLLGLINNILEISKIEAARITANLAPFDLHELLRDLEAMFRIRTVAKGVGLRVTAESGVPLRIVSDVGMIRQIFINLIGNAVKFTQAGHVIVRVSCIAGNERGLLRCEVEDTGPGISPRDRDRIFETFVQGEGMSGTRGGTGLGLTISRRYAILLGGDISLVRTESGKGSVFRCDIPFDPVDPGPMPPVAARQEVTQAFMPDGCPPRVLVVDDESINRRVIVRALETVGFAIREAADGEEALVQFDAWHPDFVLMDIRMPRMDGIQATQLIRERPHGRSTAVVALTASAFESDKNRILAGGLSGYIRKPFKLDELLQVIKEHIPVHYKHAPVIESGTRLEAEGALAKAARWPAPFRAQMCKAAREADVAELDALLARLEKSPAVEAVQRLLDAYDYAALTAVLDDPPDSEERLGQARNGVRHDA
jgi:signal transduction histidine kinase/CheY-like chemotaxis protein